MRKQEHSSEAWKKMVLRSMPAPAWLDQEAPHIDIAISSRVRYARNVSGYRFPTTAQPDELKSVQKKIVDAAKTIDPPLDIHKRLTEAERDFLLGCRLISPDFQYRDQHRTLLLDKPRILSLMVNEEDHIRLQSLTAGYSIDTAEAVAQTTLRALAEKISYVRHEDWGWLASSPVNSGEARRRSALFHLIGLAHTKRLGNVLNALAAWGLTARGLYGESSRAVGAFFQVSMTRGQMAEFRGACEYLIGEERISRREISRSELRERTDQAVEFAIASKEISMADALRVLAWVRWARTAGLDHWDGSPREVDHWISTMEVHGTQDAKTAARHRAIFLRERLE